MINTIEKIEVKQAKFESLTLVKKLNAKKKDTKKGKRRLIGKKRKTKVFKNSAKAEIAKKYLIKGKFNLKNDKVFNE